MPTVMETGFVSKQQEEYLRINNPKLYKAVLKKHGSFDKPKRNNRPNAFRHRVNNKVGR
ncbi:MAG: hypothetical protein H0Z24_05550 [Thermosipho sp. (in: Bacteria)]|nr:hypothetical protein [Thermosipho sp. (in: thermotogales)]